MLVYRPALKRAFISTLHLAYAAAFLRLQDNNRSAYESASLVSCANALKHAGYLEMLLRGKGPPMLIFKGLKVRSTADNQPDNVGRDRASYVDHESSKVTA